MNAVQQQRWRDNVEVAASREGNGCSFVGVVEVESKRQNVCKAYAVRPRLLKNEACCSCTRATVLTSNHHPPHTCIAMLEPDVRIQ
eukprot:1152055-Pelagomonas_calceolata.AAC.4